jgi:hypothetical protein
MIPRRTTPGERLLRCHRERDFSPRHTHCAVVHTSDPVRVTRCGGSRYGVADTPSSPSPRTVAPRRDHGSKRGSRPICRTSSAILQRIVSPTWCRTTRRSSFRQRGATCSSHRLPSTPGVVLYGIEDSNDPRFAVVKMNPGQITRTSCVADCQGRAYSAHSSGGQEGGAQRSRVRRRPRVLRLVA